MFQHASVAVSLLLLLHAAHALRVVRITIRQSSAFVPVALFSSTTGDDSGAALPPKKSALKVASAGSPYDALTVLQLKAALKERKLSMSGLKEELKQRLMDNDAVTGGVSEAARKRPPSIEELLGEPSDNAVAAPQPRSKSRLATTATATAATAASASDTSTTIPTAAATSTDASQSAIRRGGAVTVTVLRYGPLGASVLHAASGKTGLILKVRPLPPSSLSPISLPSLPHPTPPHLPSSFARTKSSTGRR